MTQQQNQFDLFSGATPRVFAIPPYLPFLDCLARGLLSMPQHQLANSTILLPSRRACVGLRDRLVSNALDRPILLPKLRPIGDAHDLETIDDTDPAAVQVEGSEPIGHHRRIAMLARLVRRERDVTDEQSFRLALELARLLDELQTEEVDIGKFWQLVPEEHSEHWQTTLDFLRILIELWPTLLEEFKFTEPIDWRKRRIEEEIHRAGKIKFHDPVIAAGVTGSVPVIARLLRAVARNENGCVVIPGFDPQILDHDEPSFRSTHPYNGLTKLVDEIGVMFDNIRFWPGSTQLMGDQKKFLCLYRIFDDFKDSGDAHSLPDDKDQPALIVEESDDLASEALSIAIRLRKEAEHPNRSAMLVTPDRNLARRVAAELARWQLEIDDSAGVPLDQSTPGSFLLLTAHALVDGANPVALLAALKHPLSKAGLSRREFQALVRELDLHYLRGPRINRGINGIIDLLDHLIQIKNEENESLSALVFLMRRIQQAAVSFRQLIGANAPTLKDLLAGHLEFASFLASDEQGSDRELWAKEAGETLQQFIDNFVDAADISGTINADAYPAILAVFLMRETVRKRRPDNSGIAILGQYESRLQSADLIIVGGLNEGVWPRLPSANPWMNRAMRKSIGLPDDGAKIGAAALDFLCLSAADKLVLTRSKKDLSGAPTTPSRWLTILKAQLKSQHAQETVIDREPYPDWTATLDYPKEEFPNPCQAPAPRPPRAARPTELWATDIENLVRDPYAVYAKSILRLRELDPLDADPSHAERGIVIHQILERFVKEFPVSLPSDPLTSLLHIGRQVFDTMDHHPMVQVLWWPRFEAIALWFVEVERERRLQIRHILSEVQGTLELDVSGRNYKIRARADRIEVATDGGVSVMDYKTGTLPSASLVRRGISPQLPLEAAIALVGGFAASDSTHLKEVLFVGLSGSEQNRKILDPTLHKNKEAIPVGDLAVQARDWLESLIRFFENPATPYFAVPYPEIAPRYNAYDHLERTDEWRYGR